jgi:copper resistance protein B
MKRLTIMLLSVSLAAPALAQHDEHGAEEAAHPTTDSHAGHNIRPKPQGEQEDGDAHETHHPGSAESAAESATEAGPAPPAAFSGPTHAADAVFDLREMAAAREQLRLEHGAANHNLILADRLEARFDDGHETYLWDVQGWYGGDINKLWLKGEGNFGEGPDGAEFEALYSRAIAPFFDFQAGVRQDLRSGFDQTHLVLGIQGLIPYALELDAAAFLSNEGDLTGRVEGEVDLQISQRTLLQPRIELNLAAQEIPELGVGSGLGSVEIGIRLRYEIRREFAPYLGIGWQHTLGGTSEFARADGEDRSTWQLVAGVRSWF